MPSPHDKNRSKKLASVPHDWLAPGAMAEVTMEEPGLVGSRYPARVLQVRAGKALVEFPAFEEDENSEAKLKEWVACSLITPPPPPTGADFVRRIKAGQPLDLWHEDGWWRVTVTGSGPGGISVAAEDYGAVRTVNAACLRPRWQFVGTDWQVDDTLRPLLREMLAPAAPAAPVSSSPAKAAASYVVLPTPSEDLPPGWSVELRQTGTGRKYKVYSKPGEPQCNSLKMAWQAAGGMATGGMAGGGPPQAQQGRDPAAPAALVSSSPAKAAKPAKKGSKAAVGWDATKGASVAPAAQLSGAKRKGRPPKGRSPQGGPAEDAAARPSPAAAITPGSTPDLSTHATAHARSSCGAASSSSSRDGVVAHTPVPPASAPPAKLPAVKRGRKIDVSVGGWGGVSWEQKLQLVAAPRSDWEPDGTEAAMQRVMRAVQEAAASAPLQGCEVDRRLWRGAAAQGWCMQCRDLRATLWCYTAPDGTRLLSRSEVFGWQQAHAPPELKLAGTAEDYAGQGRPPAFRLLVEGSWQQGSQGEDGDEAMEVPAGFSLAPPPSAEELAPGSEAGARLVGRALLFKWEGIGWCHGKISRQNRDERERIDGDMANFFAFYDVDGQEASHVLERGAYHCLATDGDAATWVLLQEEEQEEEEQQQQEQEEQQEQQEQQKHAKRQAWRQAQLQARRQQQGADPGPAAPP